MRQIATIDAETDPFLFGRVPEAFLWDVFDGEKHYTFDHISDTLHFLADKNWIIYAHNGGKFDYLLPGFLDSLNEFGKILIINGRLARFSIGECEFRDSYNILPIPLRDFDKGEIDYAKLEKSVRKSHMAEITQYLHRDTESLYRLVSAFRENYGDGITLAGSAMKVWQTRTGIKAPKSTRGFYKEIAPFYHGGRVECFHSGLINEPFTMIDINSAYPYAMLHEHPIDTRCDLVEYNKKDGIVNHWFYEVECVSNGAFAIHDKKLGLVFPKDKTRRTYCTTGWELNAAIETERAWGFKIKSVRKFENTINFDKYIRFFYDMKKKAAHKGTPEYIFAKLFMNSLYGKFGANPGNYANFTLAEPKYHDAMVKEGYEFAGELGPWIVMSTPLQEHEERYYNVATAASITGFVRAYLLRQMVEIKRQGGIVLYCDTDSIVYQGKIGMDYNSELGGWSSDGEFARGGIAGKKLYAFEGTDEWKAKDIKKGGNGWKTASKGVRIKPQEIIRVCKLEKVTYRRDAPSFKVKGDASFITRIVGMTARAEMF